MLLLVHGKMNHSDLVIYTVNGFCAVNEAEIDVFLKLSCFFHDPADVGNLTSGSIYPAAAAVQLQSCPTLATP